MSFPSYLDSTDYSQYLSETYPPISIDSSNLDLLIQTAYNELFVVYDLDSAPRDVAINCVYMHATHIYRSEGARSSRLDLISQGVTDAGIVEEKYKADHLPFNPIILSSLASYKRITPCFVFQMSREMEE